MKLKKIDLRGFKSFPDKTTINFKSGITGVVGPNGSGKSNISDAVRWVLGEQSAKTLRGNKMEDVIFSGTEKRKPLGFSEVTITLDNSSGKIPIDYEEVGITRRVFRSGESEYYINKNGCRLRDIRELFMDTGIGKEGYSIIGQGRIDEILSDKAEDRRSIFEEAAGIVKYKSKKDESNRKLIRTEENLIRVNDLVSELKSRERSLKNQVEKARSYKDIYSKLKKININLYLRDIDESERINKKNSENIVSIKNELKENSKNKDEITEILKKLKTQLEENQIEYNSKNEKKYNLLQNIESEKNKIELLDEKERFNLRDLERLKIEDESISENISIRNLENKDLEDEISLLEVELEEKKKIFTEKEIELKKAIDLINQEESALEENKNKAMELYNSLSDSRSELNSIVSFNENINKRTIQLADGIKEKKEALDEEIRYIESDEKLKESFKKNLTDLKLKVDRDNEELIKNENVLTKLNQDINKINIDIQTNISNYRVYKNMESSYEGYYRGVKEVLKAGEKHKEINANLIGVVAELVKVDEKYEIAISTALGGNSQNIVTGTQLGAKLIIDYLRRNKLGRVTCLPLDTIKGSEMGLNDKDRADFNVVGIASEIIEFEEKYRNIFENLLGRTVIVKDMNNAIGLSNKYKNRLRIVTLEGDVINPGGSMTGGSQGRNNSNILSRKNRIEKIEKTVKKYRIDKEKLEYNKKNLESDLNEKKTELFKIQNSIQEKEYELINLENKINNRNENKKRLEFSINNEKLEIDSLEEEIENYSKRKIQIEDEIDKLNIELEEIQISTKNLNLRVKEMKTENEILTNENIDEKIIINKKENELSNLKERQSENSKIIRNNKLEISEKLKTKTIIKGQLLEIKKDFEDTNINIDILKKDLENLEISIKESGLKKEKLESQMLEQDENLEGVLLKIDKLEKGYSKEELRNEKLRLKIQSLHDKLFLEYDIEYESAKEFRDLSLDLNNARDESKKLTDKIKKLGTVNLASIEEYEELSERLGFILSQEKDLSDAKKDLEEIISGIEKEMNEKFMNSFSKIKKNFTEIFKVLFNGGNANLILSNKEDILNTGIDIVAQPPGKRLQNLNSLSGGERSLTAVALLFAILKMKPSPFCILDEIDAALDEANIGRYTKYLREISNEMQFIIITHRKTTMEVADTLYGITMEEKGVSKLLSIELTEYEEEVS